MRHDPKVQEQMRKCRKVSTRNLNGFRAGNRDHMGELQQGAVQTSFVSLLTNALLCVVLVVVLYIGGKFHVSSRTCCIELAFIPCTWLCRNVRNETRVD